MAKKTPPLDPRPRGAARWRTRTSSIHGRGAFCLSPIAEGELIGRYAGKPITEAQACELYGHTTHTFLFLRADGMCIDGGQGGNGTRFINHGCDPNVESFEEGNGIVLRACRDIEPNEELLLDYRLQTESDRPELEYPCRCGSPKCRGTMAWTGRRLD